MTKIRHALPRKQYKFSLESALAGGVIGFMVSNLFWFLFSSVGSSSSGDVQPFLPLGSTARKLQANNGWKDLSVYVGQGGMDYMIPQQRQWHSQTS
jgi:hypothetical protein